MTTLLRNVLAIPERAGAEDYVLRLTDSVGDTRAARTLDDHVVTPALQGGVHAGHRARRRGPRLRGEPSGVPHRQLRLR